MSTYVFYAAAWQGVYDTVLAHDRPFLTAAINSAQAQAGKQTITAQALAELPHHMLADLALGLIRRHNPNPFGPALKIDPNGQYTIETAGTSN